MSLAGDQVLRYDLRAMHLSKAFEVVALPHLLDRVDLRRLEAAKEIDPERRSELGQFMTPPPVASLMASFFEEIAGDVRVLDAGAGVGSLLAAFTSEARSRSTAPQSIRASAFELDHVLASHLAKTMADCGQDALASSIPFSSEIIEGDFIEYAVDQIDFGLFRSSKVEQYTHAILNPPYKKLNSGSAARLALRRAGIETSNLYAAFLALAVQMLKQGGELVAITPRSFCNGPYFKAFRELFLSQMSLRRVHVFESRSSAFSEDAVLQENIIIHAQKGVPSPKVFVSSSGGAEDELISQRVVALADVIKPDDRDLFIHVVPDEDGGSVSTKASGLPASLTDISMSVSTGRVVDFRARNFLRKSPEPGAGPLVYPTHFSKGRIAWPKESKKPNALMDVAATEELWMPKGTYVLVKRFSSKEERRRVVAAVVEPKQLPGDRYGFENHLNVFHRQGAGLPTRQAHGLAAFLNSSLVDTFFRQFNGHTQVNATDLRSLRYPSLEQLEELGRRVRDPGLEQAALDRIVEDVLGLEGEQTVSAKQRKVEEALAILTGLGFPPAQQNERSALTLLALVGLTPKDAWAKAAAPLMGITPIMAFIAEHYGKIYKPNTRETVRRQTVHQFLDAGLVVANPDAATRPVNSPKAVYQINAKALSLLHAFGSAEWEIRLARHREEMGTLAEKYAQERETARVPVTMPDGTKLSLSPGGQNTLIKEIIEEFCSRFAPGGSVLYVGDTEEKMAISDRAALGELGVKVDAHGKMPDIVVHRPDRDWLILIEAVTSHGPVNPKRQGELAELFKDARPGLVYVTAFLTRKDMVRYLAEISWQSEVWVAESPDHMIHFDGERFLGPYPKAAKPKKK